MVMKSTGELRRREHSPDSVSSPVGDVTIDTIYEIFKNKRRRLVLHYLVNATTHRAPLGTLATQIAAWENDVPVSAITSTLRKRTYNTLQQTHLPKMDDAGLVDYDHHRGTVQLTVNPRQIDIFLTLLPRAGTFHTSSMLITGFVLWLVLASNWFAVHVLHLYQSGTSAIIVGLTLLLVLMGFVHVYLLFR